MLKKSITIGRNPTNITGLHKRLFSTHVFPSLLREHGHTLKSFNSIECHHSILNRCNDIKNFNNRFNAGKMGSLDDYSHSMHEMRSINLNKNDISDNNFKDKLKKKMIAHKYNRLNDMTTINIAIGSEDNLILFATTNALHNFLSINTNTSIYASGVRVPKYTYNTFCKCTDDTNVVSPDLITAHFKTIIRLKNLLEQIKEYNYDYDYCVVIENYISGVFVLVQDKSLKQSYANGSKKMLEFVIGTALHKLNIQSQ